MRLVRRGREEREPEVAEGRREYWERINALGSRIGEARARLGLAQGQFGIALRPPVDNNTVSGWERGMGACPPEYCLQVRRLLARRAAAEKIAAWLADENSVVTEGDLRQLIESARADGSESWPEESPETFWDVVEEEPERGAEDAPLPAEVGPSADTAPEPAVSADSAEEDAADDGSETAAEGEDARADFEEASSSLLTPEIQALLTGDQGSHAVYATEDERDAAQRRNSLRGYYRAKVRKALADNDAEALKSAADKLRDLAV